MSLVNQALGFEQLNDVRRISGYIEAGSGLQTIIAEDPNPLRRMQILAIEVVSQKRSDLQPAGSLVVTFDAETPGSGSATVATHLLVDGVHHADYEVAAQAELPRTTLRCSSPADQDLSYVVRYRWLTKPS
jgi:hypothetical protein